MNKIKSMLGEVSKLMLSNPVKCGHITKYLKIYIIDDTHMLSCFSHVWHFVIFLTVAHQAPLSMGISKQEYWSGLSCPPPGDLLDPEIEPTSLRSPTLAGRFFTTSTTWEALYNWWWYILKSLSKIPKFVSKFYHCQHVEMCSCPS